MKLFKRGFFYLAILAVIITLLTGEVEGRRKILRGRRTITRTYYRRNALPAWAIVLMVAMGQIIIGGIMYVVMRKFIIEPPLTGSYSVASTTEEP
ncbi:uncharacterized protein LOC108913319 isoform X1 [Anoplophora glabripennis]|uniref:uncharacterized protein LOC108913319 isoform X1 n=1 Tax=Anoplophora glabripennis TaxID=217634 RepID=UPI0008756A39|nr:uncharacterized protein LOC108913319 isoform X1 [Anoplophora glabripennis]